MVTGLFDLQSQRKGDLKTDRHFGSTLSIETWSDCPEIDSRKAERQKGGFVYTLFVAGGRPVWSSKMQKEPGRRSSLDLSCLLVNCAYNQSVGFGTS